MVDFSIFYKLIEYASLNKNDIVLDGGAGLGFLTEFLASRCKKVVAIEKDKALVYILKNQLRAFDNVSIMQGDLLKIILPKFNKIISIPPYYISSRLILWLLKQQFECAVLIMQKIFAEKLFADPNSEAYSWLTVVTNYYAKIDLLDSIPPEKFFPKPVVTSKILRITPWTIPPFKLDKPNLFNIFVKHLFTNRNKKLINPIHSFLKVNYKYSKLDTKKFLSFFSFREKRVRQLLPKEFGALINALPK